MAELTAGITHAQEHGPAPAVCPVLCLADADNPERNIDLVGPGSCILREQESVNFEVRLNRTAVTVEPEISIAHSARAYSMRSMSTATLSSNDSR